MESIQKARVRTIDGEDFEVPFQVLMVSKYFEGYLEDKDQVSEILDISEFSMITGEIMKDVIEFSEIVCKTRHPQINSPIHHQSIYEVVSPVIAKFAEKYSDEELCQMILVANTLNNEPLLNVLSAKLAIVLSKLKTHEIRKFFSINDQFDAQELERVQEENEEAKEIFGLNEDDD